MKQFQPAAERTSGNTTGHNKRNRTTRRCLAALAGAGALVLFLSPLAGQAQAPDTLMALRNADGTTRLSVFKNGAFLVGGDWDGGTYTSGVPAEGAGTRFMWYPERGAFRAGYVDGTQWDNANLGYHSVAAGYGTRSSGDYSTAFGYKTTAANTGTVAMGQYSVASGIASVALGYNAHTNARQGSFVFADRSVLDDGDPLTDEYFRAGVNHSASWRVSGGFRIFTSSNLSTGVTFQSGASVSNWGQSSAVISTSTGAMLTTGGVWQNASDSNRKHNIVSISGEDILVRLRRLPITQWSYKNEGSVRHLGPMAQDFRAAFGLGSDEKSIGTVDADGVALAGVKALDTRTNQQATELEGLKKENRELRNRLDALEKRTGINTAGVPLSATLLLVGATLGGFVLRRRKKEAKA
jgi:trimeric autotransporter adhesin